MARKKVLLIGGTLSQTKSVVCVGAELSGQDCYYTPFYCDGFLDFAGKLGLMNFTAAAGPLRERSMRYLRGEGVPIDDRGQARTYDLVVACTDLIVQQNVKGKRMVLVQEGLTEPEGILYQLVKHLGLPRFMANTAAFGLSFAYEKFCVASPGYFDLFAAKGVPREKMIVTGLPNQDNVDAYRQNDFPFRDFVLIATSNARETFKKDDRKQFLERALGIAGNRPVIFKLHPAERHERAIREIRALSPEATIFTEGNTEQMIANCSVLVAQYSTVALTAAALGKEVHSDIDPRLLARLVPDQNGGTSARRIAEVCLDVLEAPSMKVRQFSAALSAAKD